MGHTHSIQLSNMQGFDSNIYKNKQVSAIRERSKQFPNGHLYVEVGGHLLKDGHASRVLPGFDAQCKVSILKEAAGDQLGVIFCIDSLDIERGRVWGDNEDYQAAIYRILDSYTNAGLPKPFISINRYGGEPKTDKIRTGLEAKGYQTYVRRFIPDYPKNLDRIVAQDSGFGLDDHIPVSQHIVIVTGLGSNCGKLSTCLGQVYLDQIKLGVDSGYAKYELFPVWQLQVEHPLNLAYEAATADIGDYNEVDHFHTSAYGIHSVNYNRDVAAFPVLQELTKKVSSERNYMHTYKSPTDMGVNNAYFGIQNDEVVIEASIAEIKRRAGVYQKQVEEGIGEKAWVDTCEKLLQKATLYMKNASS